jgi:4a-hydroxytetrahydrobiopterin dehydratase
MSDLSDQHCIPCRGGVDPLTEAQIAPLHAQLKGWKVVDAHHLEKAWSFQNFAAALAFVNRLGAIAEEEGHHPDLELGWGRVGVTVYTHKINGLALADFVLAAKFDEVPAG